MKYNFNFTLLQGPVAISTEKIAVDLTETEMLFLYAADHEQDQMFMAKALKSVRMKIDNAIMQFVNNKHLPGPKLGGAFTFKNNIPDELIMDAKDNPLSDTLVYFLKNAGQIESMVFYDGVREYCNSIIREIKNK